MAKLVSKVYGDALFSLATEEDKLDLIWDEVRVICDTISHNPDFVAMLCHPEMTQEKRMSVLEDIFKDKVSDHMMGFLHVLVQKGRMGDILSILEYFDKQAKEYKKIGVVSVKTPMPLSEAQKEQIEEKLLKVTDYVELEMHYEIEKELLGGIMIRIGDRVLDNSIRTKMDVLSRQLYKVKI